MSAEPRRVVIGHLYPDLMNLYGDRGNIACLSQRARWRGIDVELRAIEAGQTLGGGVLDIIFIGGGQDQEQRLAAADLCTNKAADLRAYVNDGGVVLAVCGGYQLFGHEYRPASGEPLPGLGIFDAYTEHPGPGHRRCIGNVLARTDPRALPDIELVGFENHGGRTYLAPGAVPLARVVRGHGNNGQDQTEGCVTRNAFGTYLHGSLLPKNPAFADYLLARALERRYGNGRLDPLDDSLEERAHRVAASRAGRSVDQALLKG